MVYSSRFVLNVLINGQIVEARKDGVVAIPFGSEYVIRCRNKHKDRRALAKVFVDGENVSAGGFVIDADTALDIKRRADVNAALKFTELTSEDAKETGKDDNSDGGKGVIEVRFHLEKKHHPKKIKLPSPPPPGRVYPLPYPYPLPIPTPTPAPIDDGQGIWKKPYTSPYQPVWVGRGTTDNTLHDGHYTYCSNTLKGGPEVRCSVDAPAMDLGVSTPLTHTPTTDVSDLLERFRKGLEAPENLAPGDLKRAPIGTNKKLEEGCTVDGGVTDQSFIDVPFNAETDFVTLMLVLRGYKPDPDEKVGVVSIGPKQDEYCTNCGQKKGRKADKFCGKCGHKL